ncbi:MAG TPA: pitrilysin family protein [Terriglobales bacterium]|nr:pitrilysin family protein [Terriglobales bacterium]
MAKRSFAPWRNRGLGLVLGLALGSGLAAQSAAAGSIPVPQIPFTTFTLANGLRVVLSEDHSLPVVTESLLFNVGGRDEHPGQSGFAHLFEHLMFEGSQHAPKGVFDHLVEGYGGNDNAGTHEDYTFYYENVPSNALETVMWLDADRMAALNVTQANMKNQIAVVEEERRMRVDNAPYGPLMYINLGQAAFSNWQNAHPVIGSYKDLNAASLAEVQQFFHEYYAPRNCILTIVGDLDTAKTEALVKQYFGWIPNRGAITPVETAEPPQTAEKFATVHDTQAKLPAVAMAWQGPARGTPDFYALTMLGQLLFSGESSRLYQSLIKTNAVASGVEGDLGFPVADFTDYKSPGLFSGLVIYKPTATAATVEKLVFQQIQQVEASGVGPEELSRLRTKFSSDWIRSEQTTLDRNQLLALATLFDGKPDAANTELGNFLAVTSGDLQRVARTYLTHARATVVVDVPGAAAPAPPAPARQGGRR